MLTKLFHASKYYLFNLKFRQIHVCRIEGMQFVVFLRTFDHFLWMRAIFLFSSQVMPLYKFLLSDCLVCGYPKSNRAHFLVYFGAPTDILWGSILHLVALRLPSKLTFGFPKSFDFCRWHKIYFGMSYSELLCTVVTTDKSFWQLNSIQTSEFSGVNHIQQ